MNNEQGFTLTLRSLLIIILVTVIVLGLAIWFVAHRLERSRPHEYADAGHARYAEAGHSRRHDQDADRWR